jgi:hypothetical protein
LCLAAVSVSSKALAAVYTQQITLPTPPSSSFATSGGGDGWNVALSSTQVFNVFHHNTVLAVACHNQADASLCWPTLTRTVNDGTSSFKTPGDAGVVYDAATNKLYVYATRTADSSAGVVCIDPVLAATSTNPFCGYTRLTAANEAYNYAFSVLSAPVRDGNKLYSFNLFPGTGPGGATGTGPQNRLLCYDISTGAACSGQPYAVNLGSSAALQFPTPYVGSNLIGTQLLIPLQNDLNRLACWDVSTGSSCAGSWPVNTGAVPAYQGPAIPTLSSTGVLTGLCLGGGPASCYTLAGASVPAAPGFTAAITQNYGYNGTPVTLGPRVYVPSAYTTQVHCYDFSTSANCPGFPKGFANLNLLYTLTRDPARPTCLWVNADSGAWQIQNFDAYSGGACNGIRVLAAQFIVPQEKCNPVSYRSLQMLSPAPGSYTSATVSFKNGAGNSLGIPDKTLDATGTVDLTGLALNSATGLPQFVITLAGAAANLGQVKLELTWESNYDPACVGPGGQVTKQDTQIQTKLTDGSTTNATLSVALGTPVTDTSLVSGANATGASGTVTYTWYSDSACTTAVASGSPQAITTAGSLPASEPVSLRAGTYYPVASYSGDAGNNPSTSKCGDEVLEVVASSVPPSCALTSVVAGPPKQLIITVQSSSAGISKVEVTDSSNASVDVPSFSDGEKGALVVTATKLDQSGGSHVALRITDVDGLVTDCDPDVPGDPSTNAVNPGSASQGGCSIAGPNTGNGLLESLAGVLVGLALVRRRRAKR